MDWFWWVIAAFALGIGEMFTLDLVFGTLVVAALVGAGVALGGGAFAVQAVVAAVVAVVLLFTVRPIFLRRLKVEQKLIPSGTAAHVGATALVLADVDDLGGRVKLAGEEWSARTGGERLRAGDRVRVLSIDGATAVVAAADPPPARPAPLQGPEVPSGTDPDPTDGEHR